MSNADAGYYKAWKTGLYARLKRFTSFHVNVNPFGTNPTFAVSDPQMKWNTRLRRGPNFLQSGFRGTCTQVTLAGTLPNSLAFLQNVFLTQTNVGGYKIIDSVSLLEIFGTVEGVGDTYRNIPWQWEANEDMLFTLDNPNNYTGTLSLTLFGKNVYV
jgi:hypothetical protein